MSKERVSGVVLPRYPHRRYSYRGGVAQGAAPHRGAARAGGGQMSVSFQRVAIIGLGAVIRGSTPHFDMVAGENAKALSSLALQHAIPVINGVLTTDTIEQAIERAGTKAGNKGADAAMAAMEMISLLRKIG